jgi:hypothetical protein
MEANMLTRTNVVWLILVIAVLVATVVMFGTAHGQSRMGSAHGQGRASDPKVQDKLALGEGEVRKLLLLMNTDKNGKISKQEWMKFMEAEFDRLDVEKNGELGVKEIAQSSLHPTYSSALGK